MEKAVKNDSEYEKTRQEAYAPLIERVHVDHRDKVFIFTLSCGLGWQEIIFKLAAELDSIWEGFQGAKGPDCWEILQVKEKFGGLRFYVEYLHVEAVPRLKMDPDLERRYQTSKNAIDGAEADAGMTCERCGKPGHLAGKGYIATVCDECEKRWNERSAAGAWPSLFG